MELFAPRNDSPSASSSRTYELFRKWGLSYPFPNSSQQQLLLSVLCLLSLPKCVHTFLATRIHNVAQCSMAIMAHWLEKTHPTFICVISSYVGAKGQCCRNEQGFRLVKFINCVYLETTFFTEPKRSGTEKSHLATNLTIKRKSFLNHSSFRETWDMVKRKNAHAVSYLNLVREKPNFCTRRNPQKLLHTEQLAVWNGKGLGQCSMTVCQNFLK